MKDIGDSGWGSCGLVVLFCLFAVGYVWLQFSATGQHLLFSLR